MASLRTYGRASGGIRGLMPDETKVTKRSAKGQSDTRVMAISRSRSNTFQSVYADNAQLSVNFFGISMLLGEVSSVEDGTLGVMDHVMVHMSPEHAASLYHLLGAQIDKYRASFGELREIPE